MTAPTFTCDRCGRNGKGEDKTYQPPSEWRSLLNRLLCYDCQDAVRRDIDQFAGEGAPAREDGASSADSDAASPSPVPAVPSLVERARHRALVGEHSSIGSLAPADIELLRSLADRIEELEATVRREEADHLRTITERDDTEEWADKLAYSIAPQSVIGEHSSANNPWMNALEHQHGSGVKQEWSGRPVDLASDDRLIPLPGGRVAVAAQDLRVGDVVDGSPVIADDEGEPRHRGKYVWDLWHEGTLVLLDKAAGDE